MIKRRSRRQVYAHRHALSRQRKSQEQKNIELPPKKTLKFGKSADARRKHVARAEEQRQSKRQVDAHRHAISRQRESQEQQQTRRQIDAERHAISRQQESQENRQIRLLRSRSKQRQLRFQPFTTRQWKQGAFHYDPKHDYAAEEVITIGSMSKVCNYCRAKKWDNEPPGVCCSNGKLQLATFQVFTTTFKKSSYRLHF